MAWIACARALVEAAAGEPPRDRACDREHAPRRRCWRRRAQALDARRRAAAATLPEEFVARGSARGARRFEEITGARTQDDVLRAIFERSV